MRAALVLGAMEGLGISLLAVGLVLVFRVGRFVNFAHAQMGVLSALLVGKFVVDWGLNWWLAFVIAVAIGGGIGVLTEALVIRRVRGGTTALLIATIGVAQVLLAVTFWEWFGADRQALVDRGYPLPFEVTVEVDALTLRTHHVLAIAFVPALCVALALLLRFSLFGKAVRAIASNRDAAGLAGVPVESVVAATWGLAGVLAAVSAILAAPNQGAFVNAEAFGPSLLMVALGAAAFGGFTSIPVAVVAGVAIGMFQGGVVHLTHNVGLAQAWVFVAIVAGLVARGQTINRASATTDASFDTGARPVRVPPELRDRWLVAGARLHLAALGLFVAVVAPLLPVWDDAGSRFLLSLTAIFAIVAVSLVILTGWAGQVSLGHYAFVGAGAFVGARFLDYGWSLLAAALASGLIGAVLAVVIGIPALRLRGLTLAVTTLGFAVVAPAWLFRQPWFSKDPIRTVGAPAIRGLGTFDDQLEIYYLSVAVLAVIIFAASYLRRSGAGRVIVATRDNERAAAAFGRSPVATKVGVFSLSGFIAAFAGVLWLTAWRTVSADTITPQYSLLMIAMPVVGGLTSLAGAVAGAVVIFGIPSLTQGLVESVFPSTMQFQLAIAGVGLVVTQLYFPGGLASAVGRAWERFLRTLAAQLRERDEAVVAAGDRGASLIVRDLTVRFGGITAVDDVSITVGAGEIVGLIGTNGAGKSTLLNAISGLVSTEAGRIIAHGADLTQLGPEHRAYFGVARAFQDARLFPGLTVRETLQVALSRHHRVGLLATLARAPWVRFSERLTRARADELIAEFGLGRWADVPIADLSTGTRRVCDLAAQLATRPSLLLLDEPTAGLAQREAEQFGPLIRRVAEDLGCALLVIEHDMPLMLGLADRIYCLEAGRVIAVGTPTDVRDDPRVIASYLGTARGGADAPIASTRSGNGSATAVARAESGRKRPLRSSSGTSATVR